jgi:hypothetical protein
MNIDNNKPSSIYDNTVIFYRVFEIWYISNEFEEDEKKKINI